MAFGKKIGGGRRAGSRATILLAASIVGKGFGRRVAVMDLSATGAKLRDAQPPPAGTELWLRIAGIERLSTVQWSRGGFLGVLFDKPLIPRELHELHRQNSISIATKLKPEERLAVNDWNIGLAR
ncbi:hypothetical protein OMW55_11655 [Sphingomonas sp. BN140010]|uniref:PilZ domain-containing protein n=1 Tax=Sphingomonas arvum TaxID=2992113 RepID=A0ABT3JI93_9SPHN|nr:hypothetical protein [Sphingomonas sp. BN140010]MCW3798460.1 hypothetical protein [Sphingomonas sp. BN140010]